MIKVHNRKCEDCGRIYNAKPDFNTPGPKQNFKCPKCKPEPKPLEYRERTWR